MANTGVPTVRMSVCARTAVRATPLTDPADAQPASSASSV